MTTYTVERTIDDIEFSEDRVERLRKEIKKELIENDEPLLDSVIEERLKQKMQEIAVQQTNEEQGHNDLHRYISHEVVEH